MGSEPRIYEHVALYLQKYAHHAKTVVELGCGSGQYRRVVRGRYVGLDLTDAYYMGGRPSLLADAQQLPLVDKSADIAFCVATLCTIPDTSLVLQECRRILRPGGRMLIFDYNKWVAGRLRDSIHRFSSFSLARQLRENGFDSRIHWLCAPVKGPSVLRPMAVSIPGRFLTYLISNWIVLSGIKRAGNRQ